MIHFERNLIEFGKVDLYYYTTYYDRKINDSNTTVFETKLN